jgi:hypothetical protein
MADLLNNSTTVIDPLAHAFCLRLTQACADRKLANERAFEAWDASNRIDNPNPFGRDWRLGPGPLGRGLPERTFRYGAAPWQPIGPTATIRFVVSPNRSSSFRTPKEQAKEVAERRSHVCWGAHMSDKARHVLPYVDGKAITDGDQFETLLGEHLTWFKTLWANELGRIGLLNAAGGKSWFKSDDLHDQLHVELPDAKISQLDERAAACVDEYARLRPEEVRYHNTHFERQLKSSLKTVLNNSLAKYKKH